MKEFKIFVLLCVGTCLNSHAQTNQYRPFIKENKVWHVGYFPGANSIATRGNTYYFDGDTIVGDVNFSHGSYQLVGKEVDLQSGTIISHGTTMEIKRK